MSTPVPPDGEHVILSSVPHSVLANEHALRQVFFERYDGLLQEARTALGEDAATLAPKVVEGAFVRAWDARGRLQTKEQLEKFLVEDTHHAAARALSRRVAAHRMGGGGEHVAHAPTMKPDADTSWPHVLQAIKPQGHSQQALAEAAAVSRHEAAEHLVEISRERPWWSVVVIAVLGIGVLAALLFIVDRTSADERISTALNSTEVRVVASNPSQVGNVTLDDGTKVHLAPESKLTIPRSFGPKMRAVKIEGAASFDVARGQERPFQVVARNANITATGTAFTVRSYAADAGVTVVVTEGSVEVRRGDERETVAEGRALVVRDGSPLKTATSDERDAADAWRRGTLAIVNQPLRDVLPQLYRWYGLTILVPDSALLARPVSLRASLDSSRQAILGIERSTGAQFGYAGQNMVFRDTTAAGKAAAAKAGSPTP